MILTKVDPYDVQCAKEQRTYRFPNVNLAMGDDNIVKLSLNKIVFEFVWRAMTNIYWQGPLDINVV